jgi:oligopeptide transport system permease protein
MKFKPILRFILGLWLLVTLNFFLIRSLPGGPLERFESLNPAVDKRWLVELHLNKNIFHQYFIYVGKILQGDLGPSTSFAGSTVGQIIWEHTSVTMFLNLMALCMVFIITGVLIGLSLTNQQGWVARLSFLFSLVVVSSPSILLAPVLILIFSACGLFVA